MDTAASGGSLYQQPQRPQSLFVPPIVIPLPFQRLHQQLPPIPTNESTKLASASQHNPHNYLPKNGAHAYHIQSAKAGRTSPRPFANTLSGKSQQQRAQKHTDDHPQIWCGKGQVEPATSKYVYNYSQRKDSSEKTPMCRVAELARYNKLRHEYVLLDESGPAHKKKFTVKLILCPSQEFEASGPSIKKAQQTAAQNALDSTILPKPPQMRVPRRTSKKEELNNNAIILLNSVTAQLGISVRYREELNQPLGPISNNPLLVSPSKQPNFPLLSNFPSTLPQFCCPPAALLSPAKGLASILDLSMASPLGASSSALLPHLFPPFSIMDATNALSLLPNCLPLPPPPPLPTGLFPPPPTTSTTPNGPSNPLFPVSSPLPNNNIISYKVTITLSSDSSEHVGIASSLASAKQKAATLALAHLKPELEKFKRNKEEGGNGVEPTLMGQSPRTWPITAADQLPISQFESTSTSPDDEQSETATPDESAKESDDNPSIFLNHEADNNVLSQSGIDQTSEEQQRPRPRRKTKSVVSQIHECALRLRMNVEFEVLSETGEPHNRVYTLRCRLHSPNVAENPKASGETNKEYEAEGRGPSKKAAKQAACQQLLNQVRQLVDNDPIQLASQIVKQTGAAVSHQSHVRSGGSGQLPAKEFGKRKTIIKDKKMDPEYGHHINPISRLIQVMQVRQQKEPVFKLVAEQGQNRHKEFTVSVQCMDLQERGAGPNKKLAKRAAAEAMLARIGYVKPMPQPGKSLLKKKNVQDGGLDFMEIGHFDANEMKLTTTANNEDNQWASSECQKQDEGGGRKMQRHLDALETFADVEQALQEECANKAWECDEPTAAKHQQMMLSSSSMNDHNESSSSPDQGGESPAMRSQRRRVTFSEHVSACPPPEDSNYPAASIAPLKSDLGGRLAKRRSRDSQRVLGAEEVKKCADLVRQFMRWPNAEREKRGLVELTAQHEIDGTAPDGMADATAGLGELNFIDNNPPSMAKPPVVTTPNASAPTTTTAVMAPPTPLTVTAAASPFISSQPALCPPVLPLSSTAGFILPHLPPPPPLFGPTKYLNCATEDMNKGIGPLDPRMSPMKTPSGNGKFGLVSAKAFLEHLAKLFKFTVAFSDFPKTKNALDEEQCFTLLTLGLAKPIVCHGSGATEVDAHNDASFNALGNLLTNNLDAAK